MFFFGQNKKYDRPAGDESHQQWPCCTQCTMGGIVQLHSTQYFSDLTLSPIFNCRSPNLHINAESFEASWFVLGIIASLGSAINDTGEMYGFCSKANVHWLLTTTPIDWTAVELSIVDRDASGHQTIRIQDLYVAFHLLAVDIVDDGGVIKVLVTDARVATDSIRIHFLTFDIFLVVQIASGA